MTKDLAVLSEILLLEDCSILLADEKLLGNVFERLCQAICQEREMRRVVEIENLLYLVNSMLHGAP